jgi:signal recognition particle subunit SRP54
LDEFHPDRMASRILGMGDVISLVERAQQQFDEKEAERIHSKFKKNKFDFNDFLSQIAQIKKMGNIKDLIGMIPGMGKMIRDIDIDNDAFKKIEAIIFSMTKYERENPEELNSSRKRRIARGSGNTIVEVNQFIRQFDQMRKLMHKMTKGDMKGMPNMNAMKRNRRRR